MGNFNFRIAPTVVSSGITSEFQYGITLRDC